jgi:nicotinamidase-related amidase
MMAIELEDLVDPATTALVAMELKRVTVGDLQASSPEGAPGNPLGAIAEAVQLVPRLAALAHAARSAGARVVHCTAAFREDGLGSPRNCPILASAHKHRSRLLLGSPEAEPVLELAEPEDLVSVRLHGVAPFVGTELDSTLRALNIKTVVLVGGSVNVGILGACIEAVDFGYRVVVPRDGVIGAPADYVEMVLEHSISLLARVTTVESLLACWRPRLG